MSDPSWLRGFVPDAPGAELLSFAVLVTLKATAILGIAGLLALLLRRSTAAARHLVWACAMGALLLLPSLSLLLPDWQVAVRETAVAWMQPVESAAAVEARREAPPAVERARASFSAAAPPAQPEESAPLAREASASGGGEVAAWAWLALAWTLGSLLVLLRLIVGQLGLYRLRRRARPIDASLRWMARELAGSLGLSRPVEMLGSRSATLPMTWGVVRPTILLPAEAERWPVERRRAVLLHELAHVKRLDCLTQTLALLCCALYWFHPGVWWAARRMRVERETACDDAVLCTGVRPTEYAMQLLEVARSYRGAGVTQVAAVAMARSSQLEGRLLAVLDAARNRSRLTFRTSALAAGVAAALVLPLSALRPTVGLASSQDPAPPPSEDTIPQPSRLPALAVEADAEVAAPAAWEGMEPALEAAMAALEMEVEPVAARAAAAAVRAVSPRVAVQERQARQRERSDPRAIAALVEALRDTDAEVRRAAAHGLGEMEAAEAVPALVQALRDADAQVRRSAARALGQIEDRRAVEGLTAGLRDPDAEVRKMSAWALGQIEDARAADALATVLRDASAEVRKMAAWALSQMEDPRAVPALLTALRDESPEVRSMAAHALGEIGDRRAVEPLIAALRDSSQQVRKMSAWALGEIEDPRAAEPLAAALRDASPEAARTIVHALGEMNLSTAPQALLEAIRSPDKGVRQAVVRALGEIGDVRALPALRTALADAEPEVRRTAIRALVELDDPSALDALIEALKDPNPEVRRTAARAIADRG